MTTLHVAMDGSDGSAGCPFRTVSRAAGLAVPGDTVLVHGGCTGSGCGRGVAG
jgi:hypothetical protein